VQTGRGNKQKRRPENEPRALEEGRQLAQGLRGTRVDARGERSIHDSTQKKKPTKEKTNEREEKNIGGEKGERGRKN